MYKEYKKDFKKGRVGLIYSLFPLSYETQTVTHTSRSYYAISSITIKFCSIKIYSFNFFPFIIYYLKRNE